ncbi:MAG: Smr/MutS family protein [Thermodesulfobacteriaceae bacterium]|nr:Smr/MutS family protein [Thermodesulfobacteriaceae bacterium]
MLKSLGKLDWEKLLYHLEPFIFSESAKDYLKNLSPCWDYSSSVTVQEKTLFLWKLLERGELLEPPPLSSLEKLFNKALKRSAFLPIELAKIKEWFLTLKSFKNFLIESPFLNLFQTYQKLLFIEIQMDEILDYERLEIKDSASPNLFYIRKNIRETKELLLSRLETLKNYFYQKGYLQENLITQRQERYVLPVKIEFKNKVRGILHEVSQSGATAFIEPVSVISLANTLEELYWEEKREVNIVLKKISERIFNFYEDFLKLEKLWIDFELALAKAKLGRLCKGTFPLLKESGTLKIYSAFHPLLLLKGSYPLIENDFIIEEGLLISGPNLGGKTVSLKTIGILVLMAQSGFPIPAKAAEIPVFSKVFVDLGDDQDLLQGESSFSSHLKNLKEFLERADHQSLILLDEPGKGTNPEEGSALVAVIVEELLKKKTKLVITTHSQSLKALIAKNLKQVKISTMSYDLETLKPLYKLVYGVWGDSLAFDLAEKLGIPKELVEKAKNLLKEKPLWQWENLLKEERLLLKQKEKLYEENLEKIREKEKFLEKKEKELEELYYQKLEAQFQKWESEFKSWLKSLKEKQMEESLSKKIENKFFNRWQKFLHQILENSKFKEEEIKEGDWVYALTFKKKGEVLKIKDKMLEVKIGNLKINIPKEEVKKISSPKENKNLKEFKIETFERFQEKLKKERLKIDIRGLSVEEAINEIEKVLNKALLEETKVIYFIHGSGSGKLKAAIRGHLEKHPLIKFFEPAPPHEGGEGVTIVYL